MRGISFSTNARPDKPVPHNLRTSTALNPATGASRMMKKLSTTFRRKTNVSPTSIIAHNSNNRDTSRVSGPVLHQPRLSTETAPAPRAMTFSIGSPVDTQSESPDSPASSEPEEPEIPFFGDRDRDSESSDRPKDRPNANKVTNNVAVVRGKPAWLRDSDDPSKPKPAIHPRQLSHQPRGTPPVLKESNKPEPEYNRTRHYSFDVDRAAAAAQQNPTAALPPSGRRRRPSRRRWLLPLPESPDEPHLFTPPAGSAFERIAKHRDRAEAKVLVSACTYLEAELDRVKEEIKSKEGCCCKDAKRCDCAHMKFLTASTERMQNILCILEDRYDSIEQVYVKSEEYARAMGKFFQVTPDEFSRMISQRDVSGKKSHKSLR